jgi:Ca2+-binding RTX toxin-like protein
MAVTHGGQGADLINGTSLKDWLYGRDNNDTILAKDGDDYLKGGNGDDSLYGDAGSDRLEGNPGNDRLFGGNGNDWLGGGDGNNFLYAGAGNDTVISGRGNDVSFAGDGDDFARGAGGNDIIWGDGEADILQGGDDILRGCPGNDTLDGGAGNDEVKGGAGKDHIYSRADTGEPTGALAHVNPGQPVQGNDVFYGGFGPDTFEFMPLINAKQSIVTKHTNANGVTDWMGVAGENNNSHDHWVEGFGKDVIRDFNKGQGDQIKVTGHTVDVYSVKHLDLDGKGMLDTQILVRSNQGNGDQSNPAGAHDGDPLGEIHVYGNQLTLADIAVTDVALGVTGQGYTPGDFAFV